MANLEREISQIVQKNLGEVTVKHLHDLLAQSEESQEKVRALEKHNEDLREKNFELETEVERLKGLNLTETELDRRAKELDEKVKGLQVAELSIKLQEANKRAEIVESFTRKFINKDDGGD